MSLSLHSLFSQKKGAAYSFVLAVVVTALVLALFAFATSGPSVPQQFTPRWAQVSAVNATINVTVTNVAAATVSVQRVDIAKPSTVTAVDCPGSDKIPTGWACSKESSSTVSYQNADTPLAAGSSANFEVNITPPAVGGNQSFTITTFQTTGGGGETNSTGRINVSVDNDFPFVQLMNISARRSDGTRISINGAQTNGLFFLPNTSDGYLFVINASDNASGMNNGRVTLYYNISTNSAPGNIVNLIDYRNASTTNISSFQASNGTIGGPLSLYNITLNISSMASLNGSRIAFILLANDSVGNGNVSNSSNTTAVSTFVYNFTIDAVAPQFVDVQIANGTQVGSSNINVTNTTATFGSGGVEYIFNSSVFLNLTVLVRDDGGSGTVKVEVMNRTGGFMLLDLLTGTNGSSTQTTWVINATTNVSGGNGAYNITDLINHTSFTGDGKYNITFRATDNVSNVNATYNFTIEVDDTQPTGSVASNISIDVFTSTLSVGNATLSNASLNASNFTIFLHTSNNINNVTRNVSVFGNKGLIFNLSYLSGTPSGTATWRLNVSNGTIINLSQFCDTLAGDGTTCNFRFNFSDVMGRHNDTINLTVFVDSNAPAVTAVISPASLTTNYTGTALVNVSINDTVGPLQNVSFRIIRSNATAVGATATGGEGFYSTTAVNLSSGDLGHGDSSNPIANVTNWIPMTLGTGNNSQPNNGGTWSFTINLTAINLTDGNYTIQINATDSAGRSNATVNVTAVIFDSSIPQNISILSPSTNTFHRVNFTVNLNATERISGLKNVTVRLENGTHNSPWVGVQLAAFPSALSSVTAAGVTVRFNATAFNITHIGNGMLDNITLNATNGNFTLRLNVTDTAGNQNTSITVNVTIDTVVPFGISFVYPGNNQNQSTGFTVNLSVTNESNINTVQYRWENATYVDDTSVGANVSDWINMNNQGGPNNWNATFNMTGLNKTDGNYTIAINVTDKAGNSNTSALGNYNNSAFVQLLLDQSRPEVVYVGNPLLGNLSNSQQTDDFVVNMTTKDNRSFINEMGLFNVSNINATAFRLENSTHNLNYQNLTRPVTDLGDVTNSNRTNATFEFTSVANGNYNIRFWVNDTAGNQNTTVVVSNITLDNVAPGVAVSIVNVSPAVSGGVGVSGTIAFNATVTDNLPLNISITNQTTFTTQTSSATYGVFYRFENATHTLNWTSMSTPSFFNTVHNNTGVEHKALFNASNSTATLADGDYTVRINATDKAGNQNTTQTMSITVQNGGSKVRALNLTFQGGIFNGFANSSTDSYTFLVNTSANATCRYSLDTAITYYDDMTSTMSNNVSRAHSISFGPFRDVAASGHTIHYACKDVGGNFTASEGAASQFPFGVDTRNRFNVTIPGKTDNKWPNYLQAASAGAANGWSSFTLSTLALSDTTLNTTAGGYNVTNVLSSLLQGTAAGNFTRIYAYNASTDIWQSFMVGQSANSFINFSDESEYWINITTTERIEIR